MPLSVVSSLITVALTIYGIWVSMRPPDKKHHWRLLIGFVALGIASLLINLKQQSDNAAAQTGLREQLSAIQKSVNDLPKLAFKPAPDQNQAAESPPLSPAKRSASKPHDRTERPAAPETIYKFAVETRLTCHLKDGAEIPPTSVEWTPIGPSVARVHGLGGDLPLTFVSPVVFARQESGRIAVINRFVAGNDSDLLMQPFGFLATLKTLTVQPYFVVYAKSFESCELFEASVTVNSAAPWYYPYRTPATPIPEGQTPLLTIPLEGLAATVLR